MKFGQQGIRSGLNPDGQTLQTNSLQLAKKVHRYAFHSLEYMDDDVDMYPVQFSRSYCFSIRS